MDDDVAMADYEYDIGPEAVYARLFAIHLFTRATLEGRPFKLAVGFKPGDWFGDLAFYNAASKEWWLFHTDPTAMPIHEGGIHIQPCLDLFKSYLRLRRSWNYGGDRMRLFFVTYLALPRCTSSKVAEVDPILKFAGGQYVQMLPQPCEIASMRNQINGENLHGIVEHGTVQAFFADLTFSTSQPNMAGLINGTRNHTLNWMKSWIHPDVFRKLDQIWKPHDTLMKRFDDYWESSGQDLTMRSFLTDDVCAGCLQAVQDDLQLRVQRYGSRASSNDALEYYVNRWVTVEERQVSYVRDVQAGGRARRRTTDAMNDERFVEWLKHGDWTHSQCVALVGASGVGKTTLWQHLAFCVQRACPEVEVLLIYSEDLKERQLKSVNVNMDIEQAAEMLETIVARWNFHLLLEREQKVVVFLDAFDKLENANRLSVMNFIRVFREGKRNVKFFINSRECHQKGDHNFEELQFEKMFLRRFDEGSKRDFLRAYWRVEDTAEFRAYVNELLPRLACNTSILPIAMPLTMRMLAEAFEDSFKQYLKSAEPRTPATSRSISFLVLYERFTKKCISRTLNTKWKLNPNEPGSEATFDLIYDSIVENYQLIAMKQMGLRALLDQNHQGHTEAFFRNFPVDLHGKSAILQTTERGTAFCHETIAEFFCAKYVFERIKTTDRIRAEHMNKACAHDAVRLFFFTMLEDKIDSGASREIKRYLELLGSMGDRAVIWACVYNCGNLLWALTSVDQFMNTDPKRYASVSRGCSQDTRFSEGSTLFHLVAESNAGESMRVLLEDGSVSADVENFFLESPLTIAAEKGHLDMVKALVAGGANVNHRSGHWMAPLSRAAWHGRLEVVEFLVASGAQINPGPDATCVPLQVAAQEDHLDVVVFLVERGADVGRANVNQQTALHAAAFSKQTSSVMEYLLECGLDTDARDKYGHTALYYAIRYGYLDVVRLLAERGSAASRDDLRRSCIMNRAAARGDLAFVKYLLRGGADIDAMDYDGTPLHSAAKAGHLDVVQFLDQNGASIDLINTYEKKTALHMAAEMGRTAVVAYLLDNGAGTEQRDYNGQTALHFAAEHGHLGVVRFLLERGATTHRKNTKQETALQVAIAKKQTAVVKYLLDYGLQL